MRGHRLYEGIKRARRVVDVRRQSVAPRLLHKWPDYYARGGKYEQSIRHCRCRCSCLMCTCHRWDRRKRRQRKADDSYRDQLWDLENGVLTFT